MGPPLTSPPEQKINRMSPIFHLMWCIVRTAGKLVTGVRSPSRAVKVRSTSTSACWPACPAPPAPARPPERCDKCHAKRPIPTHARTDTHTHRRLTQTQPHHTLHATCWLINFLLVHRIACTSCAIGGAGRTLTAGRPGNGKREAANGGRDTTATGQVSFSHRRRSRLSCCGRGAARGQRGRGQGRRQAVLQTAAMP